MIHLPWYVCHDVTAQSPHHDLSMLSENGEANSQILFFVDFSSLASKNIILKEHTAQCSIYVSYMWADVKIRCNNQ